jgi:serine/threonine-protein kinase HipA
MSHHQYCKISLQALASGQRHEEYLNREFGNLFGTLAVSPCLPFTRKDFFQRSRECTRGMSISGVQQKLSLAVNKQERVLEPVRVGGEFILKPSPEEFPHAAENEHAAMVSSRLLGIKTALCGLVTFADGELAYITHRFDRDRQKGEKHHQEDLVQGFAMKTVDKYGKSYEEAGLLVKELTGHKMAAVLDMVKRVMHAYLIGNDDLHLKNLSVQRKVGNRSLYYDQLTPNYDCLFTGVFPGTDRSGFLALDLTRAETDGDFSSHYQRYGCYTGQDFLNLGRSLGLRSQPIVRFIRIIQDNEAQLCSLIERCFMPPDMKAAAIKTVKERLNAIRTIEAAVL